MTNPMFTSENTGVRLYDTTGLYQFNPDCCSMVATYNGDNTVNTVTLADPVSGHSFMQAYTYSGGNLTGATGWVKQ